MFQNIVILSFVLVVSAGLAPPAFGQEDIQLTLMRAEALYFEARFNESIQLLSQVNEKLGAQPGRVKERISAKFQMALANIGLNNAVAAKSLLMEIFALDPEFTVDAQQYSPKVIALANDAKTQQRNARCERAVEDARRSVAGRDGTALLNLLQSMKPECPELSVIEPEAAELVFKKGLSEYRHGDLSRALESFRAALRLGPKHEMAAQYLELTENKMQVAGDRALLDWQRNFQLRQFKEAGAAYRQVASFDDTSKQQTLNVMAEEYRRVLRALVELWNRACSDGDGASMNEIKNQIAELLPEPSFGADIRSKLVPCNPPPATTPPPVLVSSPAPVPETRTAAQIEPASEALARVKTDRSTDSKAPTRTGCFRMDSQLALHRLKQRVEPSFSPQALAYLQNAQANVLVKVRIEDDGSVTVLDVSGASLLLNNSVRTALEAWKFTPAMDEQGPRCVDTEIPIVISRR